MQIVSSEDNLHEISKTCFLGKNKENISNWRLLIFLPRVLSVKLNRQEKSAKSFYQLATLNFHTNALHKHLAISYS